VIFVANTLSNFARDARWMALVMSVAEWASPTDLNVKTRGTTKDPKTTKRGKDIQPLMHTDRH